jgi:hypothetical protein
MGTEIDIAGNFIYNGIKEFNRMSSFNNESDIFYILYHISVGIERLQKVLLVLLENIIVDYDEFEKSLITHNHIDLHDRIRKIYMIEFNSHQNGFLQLINSFYNSCRYNRFNFQGDLRKERDLFIKYLSERLHIEIIVDDFILNTPNDDRIKSYIGRVVGSISRKYYEAIREQAYKLGIFTYELRYESPAAKIFLPKFKRESLQEQYANEQVAIKEFIIFLINTKETSGFIRFLKSIDPLNLDVALADEYVADICEGNISQALVDEVESLYEEDVENIRERLQCVGVIGNRNCIFDGEDDFADEDDHDEYDNEE